MIESAPLFQFTLFALPFLESSIMLKRRTVLTHTATVAA